MTRVTLTPGRALRGLEAPDGRSLRIDATPDGAVRLRQDTGAVRDVAAPGEVSRVVVVATDQLPSRRPVPVLPGARHRFGEVLAVLGDAGPLLAVPIAEIGPDHAASEADHRRLARADEFAATLGLPLERATAEEAAAVLRAEAVWVEGAARRGLRRRARLQAGAIAAIAVGTWATSALVDASFRSVSTTAALVGLATVLLVAGLTIHTWRLQSAFRRVVEDPPRDASRVEVRNRLDASWPRGLRRATLQVGADEIVHTAAGSERWIAGPRSGGATACVETADGIHFVDRRGDVLASVPAAPWRSDGGPDGSDDLGRACRQAGLVHRRSDRPLAAAAPRPLTPAWTPDYPFATLGVASVGTGVVLGIAPLAAMVAAVLCAVSLLWEPALDVTAPAQAVAALAGAVALVDIWLQLRPWWWARRQRRTR